MPPILPHCPQQPDPYCNMGEGSTLSNPLLSVRKCCCCAELGVVRVTNFPQTRTPQARTPLVPQPLVSFLHLLSVVRIAVWVARVAASAQNLLSIPWHHDPASEKRDLHLETVIAEPCMKPPGKLVEGRFCCGFPGHRDHHLSAEPLPAEMSRYFWTGMHYGYNISHWLWPQNTAPCKISLSPKEIINLSFIQW